MILSNVEKEISTLKQKRDKGEDDESDVSKTSKKLEQTHQKQLQETPPLYI